MQTGIEYLGFLVKRNYIKPQPKKVEAMEKMKPSIYRKRLRMFLGMVNFYWDDLLLSRWFHIQAPFNKLAGIKWNKQWYWAKAEWVYFLEEKEMLKNETILAFQDFNKPFYLVTDSWEQL